MSWIISIIIGGLCGCIASKIMGGESKGIIKNIILGLIGGVVGGYLGSLIGIGGNGWISSALLSIAGSCLILWLGKLFFNR